MSKLAPGAEGDANKVVTAGIPLGRMGRKWDIAMACVFLASPAARCVRAGGRVGGALRCQAKEGGGRPEEAQNNNRNNQIGLGTKCLPYIFFTSHVSRGCLRERITSLLTSPPSPGLGSPPLLTCPCALHVCSFVTGDVLVVDGANWLWKPELVPRGAVSKVSRGVESSSRAVGHARSKL